METHYLVYNVDLFPFWIYFSPVPVLRKLKPEQFSHLQNRKVQVSIFYCETHCKAQLRIPLAPKSSPAMCNWPGSLCPGSRSFQFSGSALAESRHGKFKATSACGTAVPCARGPFQTCRDPFSYPVTQPSPFCHCLGAQITTF